MIIMRGRSIENIKSITYSMELVALNTHTYIRVWTFTAERFFQIVMRTVIFSVAESCTSFHQKTLKFWIWKINKN